MTSLEFLLKAVPSVLGKCQEIQENARQLDTLGNVTLEQKRKIFDDLSSVEVALKNLQIIKTCRNFNYNVGSMSTKSLALCVKNWFKDYIILDIFKKTEEIINLLPDRETSPEDIDQLIAVVKSMPVLPIQQNSLYIIIASKCALSAPEKAFNLFNQAFGSMSAEEQCIFFPHLKENTYQQGQYPQFEFKQCPICGCTHAQPYYTALALRITCYDPRYLPAKLWMSCPQCKNYYSRFYPQESIQTNPHMGLITPNPGRIVVGEPDIVAIHMWSVLLNKLKAITTGKKLLEVGVGYGLLIAVALEMGYEVQAVELNTQVAQDVADMLNFPIIHGDFLQLKEDFQVDIISMGDVIEHLSDPVAGLRKAHALLKDDGVLWLSTPNFESAFSRISKFADPMWNESSHVSYFSFNTLNVLLERTGFQLVEYLASNRYKGSMELILKKVPTK